MDLVQIEARDLPEAWYLCVRECMDKGHTYTVERGSHQGRQLYDHCWELANKVLFRKSQ